MKITKKLLMMIVMIVSMMMMTQAAFADVSEVSVGQSSAAYLVNAEGYRFFKINNTYGTNDITIATYGEGEFQLIWLGQNAITDKNTYENQYYINSTVKSCVDNAAAKTTRTHMGNVCLKYQQLLNGWNYFAIKNNSKESSAMTLYIKIGSVGKDAPFDVSIADDVNPSVPAKSADCLHNASEEGYECKHNLGRKYYKRNATGTYSETSSLEISNTALGHKLDAGTVLRAATCQYYGELEKHCTRENCTYTVKSSIDLDPNNHLELIEGINLEPTCQREGERIILCAGCTYKKTESIPKVDHEWQVVRVAVPSTCKTPGVRELSCKFNCGMEKTEAVELDQDNHTSDGGKITKEASAKEEGEKTYSCMECGKVLKKEKIAALSDNSAPSQPAEHLYHRISDTEVSYEGTQNEVEEVVIPATVRMSGKTYNVTTIADKAFYGNTKLKKVIIPDTVTSIGYKAFCQCSALKTVVIGSKLRTIGSQAFCKCTSLKSIVIPKSVKTIGSYAFYKCKKLKTITIQTTKLTDAKVGKNAFYKIYGKAKLTVPKKKYTKYKKLLKNRGVTGKSQKIVK